MINKTYRGQKIRTNWKGEKFIIHEGQYIKLKKSGEPQFWNKRELKQLDNWGKKIRRY